MNLFRTKSIEQLQTAAATSGMVKSLGAFDLILLGIGCLVYFGYSYQHSTLGRAQRAKEERGE